MGAPTRAAIIARQHELMRRAGGLSSRGQVERHASAAARHNFADEVRYEPTIEWQYAARAYGVPARWVAAWARAFRRGLYSLSQFRRRPCPGCWIHPAGEKRKPHWHCRCGVSNLVEDGWCRVCEDRVRA